MIKTLQLVLIDGRWGDDNDARVLSLGGGVLDDFLEVLLVLIQWNMLHMSWNTCIISTEEDGLSRCQSGCG